MGKHGPDPAKGGGQRNQAVRLEGAGVSKEKANSLQARPAGGEGNLSTSLHMFCKPLRAPGAFGESSH